MKSLRVKQAEFAVCLALLTLCMFPVQLLGQNSSVDWAVGDLFVGVGNGSYQQWHSGNPTASKPTYSLVNTINDGSSSLTKGCGFDLGYRFFGTNFDNNFVDRYALANEHPIVEQLSAPNPQSVALDGVANLYVGNAVGTSSNSVASGTIALWSKVTNPSDPSFGHYVNTTTFTVPVDGTTTNNTVNGSGWVDVAATTPIVGVSAISRAAGTVTVTTLAATNLPSGATVIINGVSDKSFNGTFVVTPTSATTFQYSQPGPDAPSSGGSVLDETVYYTSQGPTIRSFDIAGLNPPGTVTVSNATLFALRILPPGNGSTGILVAAQGNVLLVNGANVTKFNVFGNDNDLQALSLDPNSSSRAWAGDASSNDFTLFDFVTGKKIVTFNTGTGTTGLLGGICTVGSYSGAAFASLPSPGVATQTFSLSPNSNTLVFTSPFTGAVFTQTFVGLSQNIQATVHDSIVDASNGLSDPTVFSFNPGNPFPGSPLPGNMACDQTFTNLASLPNKCEIFQVDANPNSGYTTTDIQISGPGNAQGLLGMNPRFLRNQDEDITTDSDITGTKTKCVFTVNQQTFNSGFDICGTGFSAPTSGTVFSKKSTATVTFSFKVAPANTCPNGASQSPPACSVTSGAPCLTPLLMIVELQKPVTSNGVTVTPAPVVIPVNVAGNSGGPPTFVLSGNTWQLQVKTNDMRAGFTYVGTMVDLGPGGAGLINQQSSVTIPTIFTSFSFSK